MSQQNINIGSSPNDGTGDPLRTAMNKINENFTDLYSNPSISANVNVNSAINIVNLSTSPTTNATINALSIVFKGTAINTSINSTAGVFANSSGTVTLTPWSVTVAANQYGFISIGNTSVNATGNSSSYYIANASGNSLFNAFGAILSQTGYVWIGNSSINAVSNSSALSFANGTTNSSIGLGSLYIGNTTNRTAANSSSVSTNTVNANTKLNVGDAYGYGFTTAAVEIKGYVNTYFQAVIQNANTGTNASADLVVTADTGNDSVSYLDIGINSSNYNNSAYSVGGAYASYIYAQDNDLTIGTASNNAVIKFHANGTTSADVKMIINASAVTMPNNVTVVANSVTVYSNGIFGNVSSVDGTGTITVGNTTNKSFINATSAVIGTLNSTSIGVSGISNTGVGVTGTSNTSYGVEAVSYNSWGAVVRSANGGPLYVGNNSTEFVRVTNTGVMGIGNSSPAATDKLSINGNVTISTNTLALGTSSTSANGYTFLPNGVKMNWGWISANSSSGTVTFTSGFSTNAFVVTATSNNAGATYQPAVTAWSAIGATILTGNATSTNVYWMAIGV